MRITHHTELLQALIDKYNLKSYLEIGVQNPANNFDRIRCEKKIGVDPEFSPFTGRQDIFVMTSDRFFEKQEDYPKDILQAFDIVFIDGLHECQQVKRDFENSLKCLTDNGCILIHDCLPENEEGTLIPRQTKIWWGDVYKFCMDLKRYNNISFITYNIDNGCCVVCKSLEQSKWDKNAVKSYAERDFENYKEWGRELMNVVDEVEI